MGKRKTRHRGQPEASGRNRNRPPRNRNRPAPRRIGPRGRAPIRQTAPDRKTTQGSRDQDALQQKRSAPVAGGSHRRRSRRGGVALDRDSRFTPAGRREGETAPA